MEILLVKVGTVEIHIMVADNRETGIVFGVDGMVEHHGRVGENERPFTALVGQVTGNDGENGKGIVALFGDVLGETRVVIVDVDIRARIKGVVVANVVDDKRLVLAVPVEPFGHTLLGVTAVDDHTSDVETVTRRKGP